MRTTGDNSTQGSRPLGESDGTGAATQTGSGSSAGPEFEPAGTGTGGGFGTETDTEPVGSDTGGGFDADGDTVGVDDIVADLSEDEAEEMVLDVFEGVYGNEAEAIYSDLQEALGLDAHQILEILLGDSGGGAYGDGSSAVESEPETTAAHNDTNSLDAEDAAPGGVGFGASMNSRTFGEELAEDNLTDDSFSTEAASDGSGTFDDDSAPADDPIDLG